MALGFVGIAQAESQTNVEDAPQNPLATPWSRPQPTYRFIDPGLAPSISDNPIAAVGSNVWVGSRQGEVLQMFVVEDSPNVFNFDQLPYVDAVGLGRTMAAGNGVLLFAGGMLGSVAAAKMPLFDPGNGDFEDDEGTVFEGEVAGLGYSAAVAAGPPGTGLAFATNVNGSIGPVRTRPSDPASSRAVRTAREPPRSTSTRRSKKRVRTVT